MPEYRIGQAAELLGVSADTMRRWADAGQVKVARTAGGRRYVDGEDLARFAVEQAKNGNAFETVAPGSAEQHSDVAH